MFKKRKKTLVVLITLLFAVTAWAGLRDRSSKIELYGDKLAPGSYILAPEITAPTGTPESGYGYVYVNANDIYFKDDAGVATSMIGAASGGVANLDEAYDGGGAGAGREITIDQGAVLFSGTNAANNVFEISASAAVTQHLINLTNNGSGRDIDGTASAWYFTKAGVLGLANGLTIDNGTNNILEINENSEDLLLTFGTNLLDLSTTTGIVQIDLFDGDATTLTKAADGAADDLTISVTGAQNSSLHLASAGTGADAMTFITSAGGIDMTVAGGAAGEDIDISTDTSVNISSTEDAGNAIKLLTNGGTSETIVITNTQGTGDAAIDINGTAGGVDIDAGKAIGLTSAENTTDAVVIEATAGGVQILASAAAATEDILVTATGSSINLNATEAAADAITLTAATAAGGIDISSQADIDITTAGAAGEDITITNTGGSITMSATEADAGAITIQASAAGGDVNIDSVLGRIEIEAEEDTANALYLIADGGTASTLEIFNDTGTSVTEDAAAIQLLADAGGICIQSDANLDDALVLRVDGGTTSEITIHNDQGNTADSIELLSDAGGVTINASSGVVFTQGQTRKVKFTPKEVELDGTAPATLTDTGTDGQTNIATIAFDADGGANGDDIAFISWNVPDGYVVDSARLNIAYTFSTAEDAGDEAQFDFTINAVGANEALDAAGTALADQTTVIADASADNGNFHISQYNIEVEDIAVDDFVTIQIAVDESASALSASGTLDCLYFEIEYESTE